MIGLDRRLSVLGIQKEDVEITIKNGCSPDRVIKWDLTE